MTFYIDVDSSETFENLTKNSAVCVIDFYTNWCGPCKQLAPKLQKTVTDSSVLSQLVSSDSENLKGKLTFIKVDVDKHPELAEVFKVSSIPMIVFYKNGELQSDKVTGADLNAIVKIVTKLTGDLKPSDMKSSDLQPSELQTNL